MDKQSKNEEISEQKEVAAETTIHLIVFKLGTEEYGIRIEQVKEVTITPEITRMPKTPAFIKGVANIRGDIIAIMDLEERFSITPFNEGRNAITYTLAIEAKEYSIGIIVRDMPQSLTIPVSKIDKAPTFLQDLNFNDNYIEGIGKLGGRLIIVLDIYKILTTDEIKQLNPEKTVRVTNKKVKQ